MKISYKYCDFDFNRLERSEAIISELFNQPEKGAGDVLFQTPEQA